MKKIKVTTTAIILLAAIVLLLRSELHSQVWAPDGAVWHYSYNNFWTEGYVKIEAKGDTLIDGVSCKVLSKELFTYNYSLQLYDTLPLGKEYMFVDGDKIFIYRYNQFFVLYDFSAQPGDSWTVPATFNLGGCNNTGQTLVTATGDTTINGNSLRYIDLSYIEGSDWVIEGRVVERIGNITGYMLPEPACVIDIYEGGPLRCYSDDTFGLYNYNPVIPCDYVTHVSSEVSRSLHVFPNPIRNHMTVICNENNYQAVIYDIRGILRYKGIHFSGTSLIDLQYFEPGVYFLLIYTNKKILSQKITKL